MTLHVDDVGTVFTVTFLQAEAENTAFDLSTATVMRVVLRSPKQGMRKTKDLALSTDGSDGRAYFLTSAGDFHEPGIWRVQGYVEVGAGKWWTTETQVMVEAHL